jgi:hypothetical protein
MRLKVTLNSGHDLEHKSFGRHPDPMVIFILNGQQQKSKSCNSTVNPVWNETFYFQVQNQQTDVLYVNVYDYELVTTNKPLGNGSVTLSHLRKQVETYETILLQNCRHGTIKISLFAEDFGIDGVPQPTVVSQQPYGYMTPQTSPFGTPQPYNAPTLQQGYVTQPYLSPQTLPQPYVTSLQPYPQQPYVTQPDVPSQTPPQAFVTFPQQPYGIPPQYPQRPPTGFPQPTVFPQLPQVSEGYPQPIPPTGYLPSTNMWYPTYQ